MVAVQDVVRTRGVTPVQFASVMRELAVKAPAELDRTLLLAAKVNVLPVAKLRAPVLSGRLRERIDARTDTQGRVIVSDNVPYGNTIHWGRKTLAGHANVVKGKRYVFDAAIQAAPRTEAYLMDGLDRLAGRFLNG